MIKDLNNICDQKVFEKLFNIHAKELRRFIFFKTQDMDLAEDILQDAFIKLWDPVSYTHLTLPTIYSV